MPEGIGPLPLLTDTWPMRELLILCFNANLGFFERAGLGKARSRGARVTLVADADMVHADHLSTRFAGRAYLDARALCHGGGAFHPKLIVALGDERVEVLVGSGNTSPGGWITNAELWTKVTATAEGTPSTVHQVADFLDALPPLVRFTIGVPEILSEIAASLRGFSVTENGPTLVSSAFGPIIDQLPDTTQTTELVVSSPFFDREARALGALVERFGPESLKVVLDKHANYDGAKVAALSSRHRGSVATIAGSRYHHAKLVEWEVNGTRSALTGSANISRSALLESMAHGGNCELGLVWPIATSLCPEVGGVMSSADITEHEWDQRITSDTTEPTVLLDAVLEARGLRLDLRRPLEAEAQLQHFDGSTWVTFAMVPPGKSAPIVTIALAGGASVRLVLADGTRTAARGVTDLERTNFRHVASKRTLPGRPADFGLDPRFVSLVEQALDDVRAWVAVSRGPGTSGGTVAYEHTPPTQGWREYVDGFRSEVGDDFGFFILPHIMGLVGVAPEPRPTPDEDGEEDEGSEEDLVAAARTEHLINESEKSKHIARYRRMAEKLVATAATRPQAVQVASAVLTAGGIALGCWPSGPDLAEFLRASLRPLAQLASKEEFRRDAASIAAVNLALLRSQCRHVSDPSMAALSYTLASREIAPLLPFAQIDDVAFRCAGFVAEGLSQLADPERVMHVVESVLRPDPIAEAAQQLIDDGVVAEVEGVVIRVFGQVPHATTTAIKAIAAAQEASPVGVSAQDSKRTVFAAWVDPDLYVAEILGSRRLITHYPLNRLRPSGFLLTRQDDPSPPGTQRWPDDAPTEVLEAFSLAGLTLD